MTKMAASEHGLANNSIGDSTSPAAGPYHWQEPADAATTLPASDNRGGYSICSVAFWSFLLTQFLGAFNDNYFKQMVLLTCVSQVQQGAALAAFALPFVLLSGLGGFLSDRWAKQRVIVCCKVAEIGIMSVALLVLLRPGLSADAQLLWLISVLSLMGAHSAIFAPSKYGVLPELFRGDQLRPVNGAVQMTTFMAIIFGTVCAGFALDRIGRSMWIGSLIAIGIAVFGALASLLIPRTRIAEPRLILKWENLAVPQDVARMIRGNTGLMLAILVASVFWFLGGVTQVAVNTLGSSTLQLNKTRTSLMVAGIGIGIAAGCLVAGFFGKGRGGRSWVVVGAWSMTLSLLVIGYLGSGLAGVPANANHVDNSLYASLTQADRLEWSLRLSMVVLGLSAGMFVVPVQVYLQQAPPPEFKGRLLGVQNLVTWIGILLSAAYAWAFGRMLQAFAGEGGDSKYQWVVFVSLAVLMLPIGLLYRLPESDADHSSK